MLGFVRHDYKFIAPLHPPDPAQSAKPMECEPRASAGAKTPISRNRPVIGVGVVPMSNPSANPILRRLSAAGSSEEDISNFVRDSDRADVRFFYV